jgi:hypothetical protein
VKLPLNEYLGRGIVPIAGLTLATYYLFVLRPVAQRARELDEPLQKAWQKLGLSLDQTNPPAIDFQRITNQLAETRQALLVLENAKQLAKARLQLGAAVRAKVRADFALVDYENERSRQIEELANLAKQEQVTIQPSVLVSFPEHTADVKQPSLLWAALSLTDGLLQTACRCKVTTIHSLAVPPVLTNAAPAGGSERLAEIPLELEFSGPAASADKLLRSLPLKPDEIRAAGLPQSPADKPALFIDRLVIQKQSPEKPDEVHVWLRAVGFVLRE